MAPDLVGVGGLADLDEGWVGDFADVHDLGAAGLKAAAGGWVDRRGDVPGERNPLELDGGIGDRVGGQEGLRVGMLGFPEQGFHWSHFGQLSQVHHGDAVGQILHDIEVMGNE